MSSSPEATSANAPEGVAGVVVPTHNDGSNIGPLLTGLLAEPCVGEVFVVASACYDETVPTVERIAATGDGRVRVHVEATRSGKAAAVNLGISHITLPFVVVVSGDVLPQPGAIPRIVDALRSPRVGLAGGRPLPVNSEATFVGYAVHLLWRLHHRIALEEPKIGEVIAMRREAVIPLPPDSSVDEPWFQALIQSAGWLPAYVPEAIISNRGPGTVRDFVKQRRQVHTGNLWLKRRQAYRVPSLRPLLLAAELGRDLFDDRRRLRPVRLAWTAGAVAMEAVARMGARANYLLGRERHVWDMVESAKAPALGPDGLGLRDR
jgi:glycosyltransferase involved in cell wall biosynthesis